MKTGIPGKCHAVWSLQLTVQPEKRHYKSFGTQLVQFWSQIGDSLSAEQRPSIISVYKDSLVGISMVKGLVQGNQDHSDGCFDPSPWEGAVPTGCPAHVLVWRGCPHRLMGSAVQEGLTRVRLYRPSHLHFPEHEAHLIISRALYWTIPAYSYYNWRTYGNLGPYQFISIFQITVEIFFFCCPWICTENFFMHPIHCDDCTFKCNLLIQTKCSKIIL